MANSTVVGRSAPFIHRVQCRECKPYNNITRIECDLAWTWAGWSSAAHEARRLLPPRQYVEQLRHQRTLRGHHFAVYCITFDRSGRYVITGSDDHLVKVGHCLAHGCHSQHHNLLVDHHFHHAAGVLSRAQQFRMRSFYARKASCWDPYRSVHVSMPVKAACGTDGFSGIRKHT